MSDETLADVAAILASDPQGLWLLLGPEDAGELRRREAMMALLIAAYGKGYEQGLRKGGKRAAEDIIARLLPGSAVGSAVPDEPDQPA